MKPEVKLLKFLERGLGQQVSARFRIRGRIRGCEGRVLELQGLAQGVRAIMPGRTDGAAARILDLEPDSPEAVRLQSDLGSRQTAVVGCAVRAVDGSQGMRQFRGEN